MRPRVKGNEGERRSVHQELRAAWKDWITITQLAQNGEKWREFVDALCSPRVLLSQGVLQADLYDQEISSKL